MQLFHTDFYQMSMGLAYFILNQHNDNVVFEAFVRKINPKVNPDETHYKFKGNDYINEYIDIIKIELQDMNKVMDLFCQIVLPKVNPALQNIYRKKIQKLVNNKQIETKFVVNIYPDNGIVKPYVPVFQFIGPRWIGQLFETRICLLINSKTGYNTNQKSKAYDLIYPSRIGLNIFDAYVKSLHNMAEDLRNSSGVVTLEAGYRRAPSDEVANVASKIAIEHGWQGTSNVGAFLNGLVPLERIGGTMAHSYIMGHRNETQAYFDWDMVWPHSTMLIDTYDCVLAAKKLVENNIIPAEVRIDCDPLDKLNEAVQKVFHDAELNQIGSFLSGDLDIEKLSRMHHIPFQKCMIGTKYVNHGIAEDINCGFVYKLMRVTDLEGTFYPIKLSIGKTHRNGLKDVTVVNKQIVVKQADHFHDFKRNLIDVDPTKDVIFQ